MGLFFNYDKPGKGVYKNTPEKKGVQLFFELLWRKLSKFMQVNFVYTIISLPVMVLYYLIFVYLCSVSIGNLVDVDVINRLSVIFAILISILWGTGPMSAGFAYVMRNFARDEHTYVISDLFEKTRENFWHSLVIFLADIFVLLCGSLAIIIYWNMANGGNILFAFCAMFVFSVMIVYTAMHFYIYQLLVTFSNKIGELYKNAALLALGTLPMCILLALTITIITYFVFGYLQVIAILILSFVCWVAFMRFIADFYSARLIKRRFIKEEEQCE